MTARTATAVGGSRAWSDPLTWTPNGTPTAADDLTLDAASGAVTIDAGALGRSLTATAYLNTLTHTAGVTLTLGDATAGAANVALALGAGMTYTLGSVTTSAITFASTSATQQTVTSAGKTRGNTTYSGAGSSYLLTDATTIGATATWTMSAGTFNTGGQSMSLGLMVISGATAKTLSLQASAIAITGNSTNAVLESGTSVTHTANTAVMTFAGAAAGVNGGSWNGTSVVFAVTVATAGLINGPTLNNVTWSAAPAIKTAALQVSGAPVMTGTFTVTGNSTVNRILVLSNVVGTARSITPTAFSFTNVDFQDITAVGTAWTGTSMGNALGNTNITFDAPTTQTHTASAGGNWSDVTKWTSRVPLPQDNVVVDVNTTGTLTADMPRLGADVTFTGFTGTAAFSSTANTLYGSLTLGAGMTASGTQALTLSARSAKTITSNGRAFSQNLSVAAPGGTYTLADALNTPGDFIMTSGTFTTSNFLVTVNSMTVAGATSTVNLGTSTVSLTGTAAMTIVAFSSSAVLNGASATMVIANASANARVFSIGVRTIGTLTYTVAGSTGSLTIAGTSGTVFGTINFSDASNARTLLFTAATTTTILPGGWNVFGTAGKLMTVASATAATHNLTMSGGTVSTDYLNITNSLAGGGAYWYAGANSVDGGGNSGWRFTAPAADSATQFFFALANAGGGAFQ